MPKAATAIDIPDALEIDSIGATLMKKWDSRNLQKKSLVFQVTS